MKKIGIGIAAGLLTVSSSISAHAGARIDINDDAFIDVGMRIQVLAISSEEDLDGDGTLDSKEDFRLRRGRLRLKAVANEYVSGFLQSEVGSPTDGSGLDTRIIDAFLTLKPHEWAQFIVGQNMAPANRQNLTSSGAAMTIDRPGITYKTLTWGTRGTMGFTTRTISDSDAGLRGDVDVRDTGITLFGSGSFSEHAHVKYYLGAYDGIQEKTTDKERFTTRLQLNFFDSESSYYNKATYLGKKKTLALGASYDTQSAVAHTDDKGFIDYAYYTTDVFAEFPVGPGSLTLEAAYMALDLDSATAYDKDDDPMTAAINMKQSQGDGYYVQAGFLVDVWQPWIAYESWSSDADDQAGSFDAYRIGVSYFFLGHDANIKAGYERLKADKPFGKSSEDSLNTVVVGAYLSY